MNRRILFFLGALGLAATAHAGYKIENVKYPAEMRGGISSVTFSPSGTLIVATRFGEIWMRPASGEWRRFANGLNEPMGLVADSDRVVYIAHRPELLRATDTDGNGSADSFDVINDSWGMSQNYHAFFFGLRRDKAGNFYGALSLESTGANAEDQTAVIPPSATRGTRDTSTILEPTFHRSEVPWRGWAIQITPEGKFVPFASGFRQPNGIGMSPDDELFTNDNQGDYKPSCGLLHVARGDFHGQAQSLKWEPGFKPGTLTTEALWRRYKSPAVVFPHGPLGASAGEPVWDLSKGKFGAFGGQVFVGDFTRLVIRSSLEKIAGEWQGACFPFLGRNENANYVSGERLAAGSMRAAFAPDGSLYLGETGGWGGGSDGLQRVVWDGRVAADLHDVKLTDRGFKISFTSKMDAASLAKSGSYEITRFRYFYQWKYGSPWVDEEKIAVKDVRVAADGLSADVELSELKPGFVYEIAVTALRTADGGELANPLAYYTANRLRNGEVAVGGTTRLPRPDESALGAKAEGDLAKTTEQLLAAGEKVYRLYCVACHQPNGKGLPGGAANFVDDKTRLAKPDDQLLQVIARGNEAKGMPGFSAIISAGQRRAVLTYIRETFGDKPKLKDADVPK